MKDREYNKICSRETINEYLNKIIYYIELFQNTYSFNICENSPSYIFYFLPIILYINNFKRNEDRTHIVLDFKENNKDELFRCCIIYIRLLLIYNIIICIYNLLNNCIFITQKLIYLILLFYH